MGAPSRRRREGRESFEPLVDPSSLCPYSDESDREDWYDGWNEAEDAWLSEDIDNETKALSMVPEMIEAMKKAVEWMGEDGNNDEWYYQMKSILERLER